MFIDCHTHILNGIDDGAESLFESCKMVDKSISDGVTSIWLTPHFDAKYDSINKFKSNRNYAYKNIVNSYLGVNISFVLAAEVKLRGELFSVNDLSSLCINGGNNMLVEFAGGSSITDIKRMLGKLIYSYNINPIIAHIERYKELFHSNKEINALISMGCKLQMSTGILVGIGLNSLMAFRRIQKNEITLLGTDCHNMTTRPPNSQKALNTLQEVLGSKTIDRLNSNAAEIAIRFEEKRLFV